MGRGVSEIPGADLPASERASWFSLSLRNLSLAMAIWSGGGGGSERCRGWWWGECFREMEGGLGERARGKARGREGGREREEERNDSADARRVSDRRQPVPAAARP